MCQVVHLKEEVWKTGICYTYDRLHWKILWVSGNKYKIIKPHAIEELYKVNKLAILIEFIDYLLHIKAFC